MRKQTSKSGVLFLVTSDNISSVTELSCEEEMVLWKWLVAWAKTVDVFECLGVNKGELARGRSDHIAIFLVKIS
jgi:hypothetical protein